MYHNVKRSLLTLRREKKTFETQTSRTNRPETWPCNFLQTNGFLL